MAQFWGIRKVKVVKVLQAGHQLSELGNITAALADFVQECTAFMAACYGHVQASNMSQLRYKIWKLKAAKAC